MAGDDTLDLELEVTRHDRDAARAKVRELEAESDRRAWMLEASQEKVRELETKIEVYESALFTPEELAERDA